MVAGPFVGATHRQSIRSALGVCRLPACARVSVHVTPALTLAVSGSRVLAPRQDARCRLPLDCVYAGGGPTRPAEDCRRAGLAVVQECEHTSFSAQPHSCGVSSPWPAASFPQSLQLKTYYLPAPPGAALGRSFIL